MDPDKRHVGGWWIFMLVLLVPTVILFATIDVASIFTRTVVEREVFENSYQYSEARKTEIATYRAQMAELEAQLRNPALDEGTRAGITAQLSGLRVRLSAAQQRSQ